MTEVVNLLRRVLIALWPLGDRRFEIVLFRFDVSKFRRAAVVPLTICYAIRVSP
jgi:hypothetical protein